MCVIQSTLGTMQMDQCLRQDNVRCSPSLSTKLRYGRWNQSSLFSQSLSSAREATPMAKYSQRKLSASKAVLSAPFEEPCHICFNFIGMSGKQTGEFLIKSINMLSFLWKQKKHFQESIRSTLKYQPEISEISVY